MNNEIEVWKDVVGYEGMYQVSTYGRVKSLDRYMGHRQSGLALFKGLPKKLTKLHGYLTTGLTKEKKKITFKVHYLVMLTFVGERPIVNGQPLVIDHIDEDKANNHLSNLRYLTSRQNVSRPRASNSSQYAGVSWSNTKNRWVAGICQDRVRTYLGSFKDELDARDAYVDHLAKINEPPSPSE